MLQSYENFSSGELNNGLKMKMYIPRKSLK
jgi:hypothetical protein